MMRITKITEKVPKDVVLSDGKYMGTWGGYVIEVRYNGKTYELTTEEGIRGIGVKVVVTVANGVATFEQINN